MTVLITIFRQIEPHLRRLEHDVRFEMVSLLSRAEIPPLQSRAA